MPGERPEGDFASAARITTEFYDWERRGRGWTVWDYPVQLEPPFRPLTFSATAPSVDDGRRASWFSALVRAFLRAETPAGEPQPDSPEEIDAFPASVCERATIQVALPPDVKVAVEAAERFLLSLGQVEAPVSFEVVASSEVIVVQFTCASSNARQLLEQLRAHFPEAIFSEGTDVIANEWGPGLSNQSVIVDFGLSQEFMRPLRTTAKFDVDPLVAVTGALADLEPSEAALLQILFQPVVNRWAEEAVAAVSGFDGRGLFDDAPDLVPSAKEKVEQSLFAVVVRVAARSRAKSESLTLARRVAGAFAQLANPRSNELIALSNDDYPDEVHERDLIRRQSRRTGMLLNAAELVTLVHPPSASVRSPKLARGHRRTKLAPKALSGHELVLGENSHGSSTSPVSISVEHRVRHTHVVGASGTGKSTFILNAILQDLDRGNGLALIDPHGDLVEQVLGLVPDRRVDDVILVDPADAERPVGFNILNAHSELEKTLLSSDLVAVFRRLSTSWGDQMTSVLSNAVLAFLESTRGGTLADLRRLLIEKEFRAEFLETVTDPEVRYYWQKEFPLLAGRPQAPLLTRLDTFLRPKLVRNMMVQSENRLDFASIMNERKILLVKLAQGAIGEENAALLGTLFVAKIHQLALGRQALSQADRQPFYVYLDEFQHFVTPSMATLLTGARKYGIGLVLAHQELRQLWNQERDVAGAVLANAATRICFRVGDDDAKKLEDGFTSFTARDLQNLGVGQAICRVERVEWDFSLTTRPLPATSTEASLRRREEIVRRSRERYGAAPAAHAVAASTDSPPAVPTKGRADQKRAQSPPARDRDLVPVTGVAAAPPISDPPGKGRGGAQHKYLQELIRRWADVHDWRPTIEQVVLDGLGSVDVALEKGDRRVAVEICVSSPIDWEIGNVQKCLAAGFEQVVSVAVEQRSARKLKKAVIEGFGEAVPNVHVLSPEELFVFLDGLDEATATPTERVSRGYKVRVTRSPSPTAVSPTQVVAQTIVGALRRLGAKR